MIQQTYGDLKPELSRVCGTTGMSVTDPRVLIRVNQAVQELMNEGAWPGVVDRWKIRAVSGKIVLPPELDMMLEFTVDGFPQTIMSPWAEFVNYGPAMAEDLLPRFGTSARTFWWGLQNGNLYDRGEKPVYTEIPVSDGSCGDSTIPVGPWVIRQYVSVEETAGAYATVQGLDPDGLVVRTQLTDGSGTWINGEQIPISNGSSYFESTSQFSKITAYTKPETNGYVRLTAWNGTDEVELSNYAPWETTPSYHHYFSPRLAVLNRESGTECLRVVLARCRRRFVAVEGDTDVMMIGNVLALGEMIIAQWKRQAGNWDDYVAHKGIAVEIMKKESIAYTGKVRIPALTFQRGAALGTMPAIR